MAGELNGLNALKVDNLFTIFIHCVFHRLNLSVSQVKLELHSNKVALQYVEAAHLVVHTLTCQRCPVPERCVVARFHLGKQV